MSIFYVYAYLDPRKPGVFQYKDFRFDYEPFYIGKGCQRISKGQKGRIPWNKGLNKEQMLQKRGL